MIIFLVRKYVGIVLVLAVLLTALPLFFGGSWRETVLTAFFWSSLAAAPLTYWELRRHHLWPLYDNLRLPRLGLLAILTGIAEAMVLIASLLI